jgi:xanthine phosphoribosyltransferase
VQEVEVKKFYKNSWDEFHADSKALAERLRQVGKKWDAILSVARGGLVPAVIIGEILNIRKVETISIIAYNEDDNNPKLQDQITVSKPAVGVGTGAGWLIIDDLVDTGRTFDYLRKLYPDAFFASVYAKPMGRRSTDCFVREFKQDTWIGLPWDLVDPEKFQ